MTKLEALKIAAETGDEYACRWVVSDPDCTEDILIIVVSHRSLNYKVRIQALKHKNSTDKVVEAINYSVSGSICKAVLNSDNFSDVVKESWIDSIAFDRIDQHYYIHKNNIDLCIKDHYSSLNNHLKDKIYAKLSRRVRYS